MNKINSTIILAKSHAKANRISKMRNRIRKALELSKIYNIEILEWADTDGCPYCIEDKVRGNY